MVSGARAQFKGTGAVNGVSGFSFLLALIVGQINGGSGGDKFRIRIWWDDAAGEHDVYDNGVNQAIGAGNIVVHTSK